MRSTIRKEEELKLYDRLSRLTYRQACALCGENGDRLIAAGGKYHIDLDEQVYLRGDLFRVNVSDAIVTVTTMASQRHRLKWNCSTCDRACEHLGAALSLILEEKTTLGLAAPPEESIPTELLSAQELIDTELKARDERSRRERMRVKSTQPRVLWTDYLVTNPASGKTYRVALRGWEPGESFCSCPDFRVNTLGTCKHIMRVMRTARRKFSPATCRRAYAQRELAVHLRYAEDLELRLLVPDDLGAAPQRIVRPFADRAISNVRKLTSCIRQLAALGVDVTVYPDAEEWIQFRLMQERIGSKVKEIRQDPKRHPLRHELLKVELLPYQLDGIAFAAGAGRAILADDMGLGKTIQGVGVAEFLAREVRIAKVLVICPASLKAQWQGEIGRFSDRDCQVVLGSVAARARQYENDRFFTVCNYEQVLRDVLAIERVKWDLIILDEGQRIKNWEAKTSRVVKGLKAPFALVLSGTPLENRLDDLYSIVQFVDDRSLGPAFRFFHRHRVVNETGRVLGYRNLREVRERLQPVFLRRTRDEVMKDLPPRMTEIIRITPTAEQQDLHDAQARIISSIVNKSYISEMDLLRLQKALLICRMAADSTFLVDKDAPGFSSKLDELDELFGRLGQDPKRKAVLFSEWTTMLDLIEPLAEKHGLDFVRLDGSVPQRKRQQLVHRFSKDAACRLFLTTNAGSTGLNLQAADTVINVDLPWNPAVLEQRIGRAHRMGQKQPVQVFILVTVETIEENMLATLSAKHSLALAALDVDSEVDEIDLISGVEELKRRLEVLLGARPEAPPEVRSKTSSTAEADRLARQEKVAAAGGELLSAAFSFLSELIPSSKKDATTTQDQETRHLAAAVKASLSDAVEKDDQGRLHLKVTLADSGALDSLAESLARLMAQRGEK